MATTVPKHEICPEQSLAPSQPDRRWTYDEMLAELPETNQPAELWDGQLLMSPAPTPRHQMAVVQITVMLSNFVTSRRLGQVLVSPIDVILSPTRVVQPDVIYISESRKHVIQDRVRGVPDLAVEVISEGSRRRDRVDKKALYEQHGLPEYWIVDLETRTIEIFNLVSGAYQLSSHGVGPEPVVSKVLDGFSISVDQLEPNEGA